MLNKLRYILLFCSIASFGQNILSFSNDQYSGINGAIFSPTTPYFNPNKWDVNIVSEDVMFRNNYGYISDKSVLGLLKGDIKTANHRRGIRGDSESNVLDFYTDHFVSYYVENDVMGPSFSFKQKIKDQTFRLGFFTRLRTQSSVKDFDNYMRYANQEIIEPKEYAFQPVKVNLMNWGEIGLNLSTNLYTTNTQELIVGANLKYLIGLDGAVINSKNQIKLEADTISNPGRVDIYASNYNIDASYATNYDFDGEKYSLKSRGNGFALDLGIALVNRRLNDELYDFKLSANIMDIGYVNFKGENHQLYNPSQRVQIQNNPTLDNTDFESISQYMKLLSNEVYGDENESLKGNKFTIGLPTSLNINMSKKIRDNHYWNVNWIQRTPIFENSLKRINVLQTSYAIQKDGFAIAPSVSLYDYENITFGGYIRIGPLILGSDNALPFVFKQKKLNAGSFYFGIKLYPFWDSEAKRRNREPCYCD